MAINIVPFIFSLLLIFTLVTGIITLLTSVENTYQRNTLIFLICVWAGLIGLIARRQLIVYSNTEVIEGYLSNGLILGGMIGVLSLVIYGASVLFHKRFNWKRVLLFILPAILSVVINSILNTYEGIAVNHFYPTLIDFMENISTHGLISRIMMFAIQIAYIAILIYNIIHLVPIYNKYFEETQSEDRHNMNWLYGYIVSICAISVAYLVLVFRITYFTQIFFSLVVTISFVILIASNGLYRHFPNLDEIRLKWSFRKGWIKWEKGDAPIVCDQAHDQMCEKIATWMRDERPYIYTQFAMSDIIKQFPELNGRTLVETFARRNYTFQSYVREVRINEAIRIMDESIVPLRFNEVYHKVGFSHYSSFSRAFTAVKGVSPSNYTSNR